MKYVWNYNQALDFARKAHSGQVDKMGNPYINHCLQVASLVPYECKIPALLHDIIEDTDYTIEELNVAEVDAVTILALSRPDGDNRPTYKQFILKIAELEGEEGRKARIIKIADLITNITRECPPEMQGIREKRYIPALKTLHKAQIKFNEKLIPETTYRY